VEKTMNNNTNKTSFRKLYAFGVKLPIDLSLSENPLGCSPRVAMVLKGLSAKDFFDYPDPDSSKLRMALSKRLQVEANSIFVTNGSEAIIKLLPQVLLNEGNEVVIPELTFPMFEIATRLAGGRIVFSKMTDKFAIDINDAKARVSKNTKLVFLCNPNNPTGQIIQKQKILNFIKSVKANVVVDEANIEFGGETVIGEVRRLKNLIVLRTFSKGFGLAGFRVGFCVANRDVIERLKGAGQPFPVSSIAQKAAVLALEDRRFMKKTKEFMEKERVFLTKELSLRGFRVVESEANNLLVEVNKVFKSSTEFVNKLNEKGVSVVDGASFKGLNGRFIRVSPRLRITNEKFIKAIDDILCELAIKKADD